MSEGAAFERGKGREKEVLERWGGALHRRYNKEALERWRSASVWTDAPAPPRPVNDAAAPVKRPTPPPMAGGRVLGLDDGGDLVLLNREHRRGIVLLLVSTALVGSSVAMLPRRPSVTSIPPSPQLTLFTKPLRSSQHSTPRPSRAKGFRGALRKAPLVGATALWLLWRFCERGARGGTPRGRLTTPGCASVPRAVVERAVQGADC